MAGSWRGWVMAGLSDGRGAGGAGSCEGGSWLLPQPRDPSPFLPRRHSLRAILVGGIRLIRFCDISAPVISPPSSPPPPPAATRSWPSLALTSTWSTSTWMNIS